MSDKTTKPLTSAILDRSGIPEERRIIDMEGTASLLHRRYEMRDTTEPDGVPVPGGRRVHIYHRKTGLRSEPMETFVRDLKIGAS